jgi:hypothetical protein
LILGSLVRVAKQHDVVFIDEHSSDAPYPRYWE